MLEKKYKAVLNMAGFLQTHAESLAAKLEELDLEQSVQASECLAQSRRNSAGNPGRSRAITAGSVNDCQQERCARPSRVSDHIAAKSAIYPINFIDLLQK